MRWRRQHPRGYPAVFLYDLLEEPPSVPPKPKNLVPGSYGPGIHSRSGRGLSGQHQLRKLPARGSRQPLRSLIRALRHLSIWISWGAAFHAFHQRSDFLVHLLARHILDHLDAFRELKHESSSFS